MSSRIYTHNIMFSRSACEAERNDLLDKWERMYSMAKAKKWALEGKYTRFNKKSNRKTN